jgi:hypothetical protein
VNTDEVGCDYFYEIFDEVVGEHRRRWGNCLILIQLSQLCEIILGGEHLLQGIEDKVLRILEEIIAGMPRRIEQRLNLFYHLYSRKEAYKDIKHSLLLHPA